MKFARQILFVIVSLSAAFTSAGVLASDSWPSEPIKFIVPYAAGGASDVTARLIAQNIAGPLGQPVIVENRSGAGGNIGTDAVAKSPADGYTMLLAYTGPMSINPFVYKNLSFDPAKDFEPVAQVAEAPLIMVINASVPAKNIPELVEQIEANPNKYFCGSSGIGGADYLACEVFKSRTATTVTTVPYRGGAPAVLDLIAGRTQIQFATIPGVVEHIRNGVVRPLAILSNKRFDLFPDVPTITEAGMPNFDISNWYGVTVPAGTPPAIIKRLSAELNIALQEPELHARFLQLGLVPMWTSSEEFVDYMKGERARWESVVRISGTTIE